MNSRKIPLKRRYVTSGRGKYSVGRNWRKSGLGKTTAATFRKLISQIGESASAGPAIEGAGMYTGGGLYTGSGLYQSGAVATNSLVSIANNRELIPEFSAHPDDSGTIILSRREYISDVYAPGYLNGIDGALVPFASQVFNLNPALEKTFPFMSQIAQNYEEYEFIQMIFTFRSTTTDIGSSTSGQCGTIIMATNYNAAAGAFTNKSTMMEYMGAMSAKATENMLHGVECDPAKLSLPSNGLYTRANPVVTGQDLKTYDHGTFQIAVANAPSQYANQVLGELWVSYTCKLRKPKLFTGLGLGISRDVFVGNAFADGAGNVTGSPYWVLGFDPLRGQQNNIGCKIEQYSLDWTQMQITFPAAYSGVLRVSFFVRAKGLLPDGLTDPVSVIATTGNVVPLADIYGTYNDALATYSAPNAGPICQSFSKEAFMVIVHVSVTPATNGTDNKLFLNFKDSIKWDQMIQTQIDVTEYNSGFSYRSQNIAPTDRPILVNSSGVVTIPS